MIAPSQSQANTVYISPESITLGNYRFDTDRVQDVRVADLAYLLILGTFTCMALNNLVGKMANYDHSTQWLRDLLMVAFIVFMVPGFALQIVWMVERKTRYVHIIQLRGSFGRRCVYATLDQAEVDAIVADINSAIAAVKVPA